VLALIHVIVLQDGQAPIALLSIVTQIIVLEMELVLALIYVIVLQDGLDHLAVSFLAVQ